MATTNYSWNLPTVGGSENTWGTQLNANWTALDTLLGGTNATEFAILDGATVTTAELNILDGVTATTAEINILDGLTGVTGADGVLVTGTAGTSGQLAQWNSDGDIVGYTLQTLAQSAWETGTDTTESTVSPAKVRASIKPALNASGSAPIYASRAWVNFNGTGTVAIRESGNASSITDHAVGSYTINFTTALPDANYSTVITSSSGNSEQSWLLSDAGPNLNSGGYDPNLTTTSSIRVLGGNGGISTPYDAAIICVAIFR